MLTTSIRNVCSEITFNALNTIWLNLKVSSSKFLKFTAELKMVCTFTKPASQAIPLVLCFTVSEWCPLREAYHMSRQPSIKVDMKSIVKLTHNQNSSNSRRYFQTHFLHDDVIKWKHFPRYWPFVRGIHRSPVNSPHKGQWRGALMFPLICVWINGWVNNREAGDLRRYRAHYHAIVMRKEILYHNIFKTLFGKIRVYWIFSCTNGWLTQQYPSSQIHIN